MAAIALYAAADYTDGLDAANRGDYATAYCTDQTPVYNKLLTT